MQKWHLKILVPSRAWVLILGYICGLPKDLLKLQYHILLLWEPQHLWGEAGIRDAEHEQNQEVVFNRTGAVYRAVLIFTLHMCTHNTRHLLSSDDITNKLLILINRLLNQKSNSTEVHQSRQSPIIFFLLVRKLCPINCQLPVATSQAADGTAHASTLGTADHSPPWYVFTTCVQQPNHHIACMKRTRDILNGTLPVFQIL